MLDNIFLSDELRALAARRKKASEFTSAPQGKADALAAEGWETLRVNKSSVRMSRPKPTSVMLEDRVWSLLYRMGFEFMSGDGGARLGVPGESPYKSGNQLDIVAIDSEVAITIECKSAEKPQKYATFQEDLGKFNPLRQRFAEAVHERAPLPYRRIPVLALFTWNLALTDNDCDRAEAEKVLVFDDKDLDYYERLVAHLGPAAKYQFLADLLPGRQVRGLELKVPALRAKMGKNCFYMFAIRPDYLLKIAYVSHRAKGKPTDVDTYQRMIKKGRLTQIRKFIDGGGVFPTNIVVNFENGKYLRFEPSKLETDKDGARVRGATSRAHLPGCVDYRRPASGLCVLRK